MRHPITTTLSHLSRTASLDGDAISFAPREILVQAKGNQGSDKGPPLVLSPPRSRSIAIESDSISEMSRDDSTALISPPSVSGKKSSSHKGPRFRRSRSSENKNTKKLSPAAVLILSNEQDEQGCSSKQETTAAHNASFASKRGVLRRPFLHNNNESVKRKHGKKTKTTATATSTPSSPSYPSLPSFLRLRNLQDILTGKPTTTTTTANINKTPNSHRQEPLRGEGRGGGGSPLVPRRTNSLPSVSSQTSDFSLETPDKLFNLYEQDLSEYGDGEFSILETIIRSNVVKHKDGTHGDDSSAVPRNAAIDAMMQSVLKKGSANQPSATNVVRPHGIPQQQGQEVSVRDHEHIARPAVPLVDLTIPEEIDATTLVTDEATVGFLGIVAKGHKAAKTASDPNAKESTTKSRSFLRNGKKSWVALVKALKDSPENAARRNRGGNDEKEEEEEKIPEDQEELYQEYQSMTSSLPSAMEDAKLSKKGREAQESSKGHEPLLVGNWLRVVAGDKQGRLDKEWQNDDTKNQVPNAVDVTQTQQNPSSGISYGENKAKTTRALQQTEPFDTEQPVALPPALRRGMSSFSAASSIDENSIREPFVMDSKFLTRNNNRAIQSYGNSNAGLEYMMGQTTASVLSCAETVSDGAASLLFPGERETYATTRCDDVGQTAEDTVTVLDDLATAAMHEIELMWSCLVEDDQEGHPRSTEVRGYASKRKGKKKEVLPIIFSFSSDVSDVARDDTELRRNVESGANNDDDGKSQDIDKRMGAGDHEELSRKKEAKEKEVQREVSSTWVEQHENSSMMEGKQEESKREETETKEPVENELQENEPTDNIPQANKLDKEETEEDEEMRELHEAALVGKGESPHSVEQNSAPGKHGDSKRQLDPVFCTSPTMEDQPNDATSDEKVNHSFGDSQLEHGAPEASSSEKDSGDDKNSCTMKEKRHEENGTNENNSSSKIPKESKKKQKAFWKRISPHRSKRGLETSKLYDDEIPLTISSSQSEEDSVVVAESESLKAAVADDSGSLEGYNIRTNNDVGELLCLNAMFCFAL